MICSIYQKYCKIWTVYVHRKLENIYPRCPFPGSMWHVRRQDHSSSHLALKVRVVYGNERQMRREGLAASVCPHCSFSPPMSSFPLCVQPCFLVIRRTRTLTKNLGLWQPCCWLFTPFAVSCQTPDIRSFCVCTVTLWLESSTLYTFNLLFSHVLSQTLMFYEDKPLSNNFKHFMQPSLNWNTLKFPKENR